MPIVYLINFLLVDFCFSLCKYILVFMFDYFLGENSYKVKGYALAKLPSLEAVPIDEATSRLLFRMHRSLSHLIVRGTAPH